MISIIIAYYNSSSYLDRLAKCLDQQQNCEVVIVDDASQKDEADKLRHYVKRHGWSLVTHQYNQGPGAARNTGIAYATGEYLFFLDADDMIHPQTSLILERVIRAHHPDVITFDMVMKTPKRKIDYSMIPGADLGYVEPEYALAYTMSLTVGKCYRRQMIRQYNIVFGTMKRHEDTAFTKSALAVAHSVYNVPHKLYLYIVTPGSLVSSRENASVDSSFQALEAVMATAKEHRTQAVQYVYIVEAIISCAMKTRLLRMSRQQMRELFERFDRDQPGWYDNPYLRQASFRYRLIARLVNSRQYLALNALNLADSCARVLTGRS
ncbi:MAG: glycosyltransferase [Actinomycetaceae bacterium]|nr:glycosyltransferase [Actinomycetaceae bacterium]MDO5747030.1 glycosyltransferase [Actinomycetaceae bacterium]